MIDNFEYPQGDVQTWDEATGDRVIASVSPAVKRIIRRIAPWGHAFEWRRTRRELMALRAYMIGGAIPADEKALAQAAQPELRIRDRASGLSFLPTEPLTLSLENFDAFDSQIVTAAYSRYVLNVLFGRQLPEINLHDFGEGIPSVLKAPVIDFDASDRGTCERILRELTAASRNIGGFRRLWLRGQRVEYPAARPARVLGHLHFAEAGKTFPSLVPSLGRFALKNPGNVNFAYAFSGPSHWWKKPFLIWVIRQNPAWLAHYPEFTARLEDSLRSDDDDAFARLLGEMMLDPKVPAEVDDLRQWFFVHYKFSAWTWVLQQYGYLASMLDVTDDLDSALFFSQARMIDGRFTMPEPEEGRVIYVFAEVGDSGVFWDTERVDWGDTGWSRQLPERVVRQRAGCLIGSTWFRQNFYGHLVVARIRLHGVSCVSSKTVQEMFPPPENDLLLRTLLESRPAPEGLYW